MNIYSSLESWIVYDLWQYPKDLALRVAIVNLSLLELLLYTSEYRSVFRSINAGRFRSIMDWDISPKTQFLMPYYGGSDFAERTSALDDSKVFRTSLSRRVTMRDFRKSLWNNLRFSIIEWMWMESNEWEQGIIRKS